MRMELHTVKAPTWTQSAYGEPEATYGEASTIRMMIGWTAMIKQDLNDAHYREFEFVGLTHAMPSEGSLIDDLYVVGHVEPGRWNRVFMNYAKGADRTYTDPEEEDDELGSGDIEQTE